MIIGLCGLQGSGKDTVAAHLVSNHGFIKLSFASILKDILSVLFGWDRGRLEGITKEDRAWREEVDEWWSQELNISNFTPRYAMQFIGTDLFRNHFHEDIWLLCVKRRLSLHKNVVITDCRFENEIQMLEKQPDCHIIYIERPPLPDWTTIFNRELSIEDYESELKRANVHPSDYFIFYRTYFGEGFKYKIINDGTIKKLQKEVDNFISNNL